MIVTDGVFSMDGDLAPVKQLLELAQQYDALLLDDAHGFSVLGKNGHGILEQENVFSDRIVYVGTLRKAAGVSGAFVCAEQTLIEWLNPKRVSFYLQYSHTTSNSAHSFKEFRNHS